MPNITSLGVGSGLDLEAIVTAYVNSQAVPQEVRLQEKEERLNLELSGVGSFKSALSEFNSVLKKLTKDDAFNKQTVSSDNDAIAVKSNGFASNGNFAIDVTQLAQGSRLNSQTFTSSSDTVGSGTLTLGNGSDSFDINVEATDTLSSIRDKINESSDNFGVTVNVLNGSSGSFLVFDSQITGADNALSITSSDSSLDNISTNNTVVKNAQDAQIVIDGSTTVNSSTNEFKNTIEDLTLNVSQLTEAGKSANISVTQDTENGKDLINEFINGFNSLVDNLTGLAAPKQGRLAFDPNIRQIKQDLANTVIGSVSGLSGSVDALADLGLEIDKTGKMKISTFSSENIASGQEKLNSALANKTDEIGKLFASDNGIATKMSELIDGYIASDGVLTQREKSLNERVSGIKDEYEELETRLRSYEDTLRNRFSFLDSTIAQYNATGDFIKASLAKSNTK